MRDEELGMRVVARATVLGLAGLTAFGAAGCNRGGGNGGTTTIIQQPGGGNAGSSATSSSATPASVAPINDPKQLCSQIFVKTRSLGNAVSAFWNIATTPEGWSYTDQKTQDAIARVQKEYDQVFPALDGIVGKEVPSGVGDSANNYLKAIKDFSSAILEQRTNDTLNPDASNYGHAKENLDSACKAAG